MILKMSLICLGITLTLALSYELMAWFFTIKGMAGLNPLVAMVVELWMSFVLTVALWLIGLSVIEHWRKNHEEH